MNDSEKERRKQIDLALVAMEKQFGKGAVLRLGSRNVLPVTVMASICRWSFISRMTACTPPAYQKKMAG